MTSGGMVGKVRDIKEVESEGIKETRVTLETGTATVVVERSRIVRIGGADGARSHAGMSLLPLHLLGSPVLRQRSAEVGARGRRGPPPGGRHVRDHGRRPRRRARRQPGGRRAAGGRGGRRRRPLRHDRPGDRRERGPGDRRGGLPLDSGDLRRRDPARAGRCWRPPIAKATATAGRPPGSRPARSSTRSTTSTASSSSTT